MPTLEKVAVRTATGLSRRSFLGRTAALLGAAAAGTTMSVVLPAKRASASSCLYGATCDNGGRATSNSCWLVCSECRCGDKAARICDCCGGSSCTPNHNCFNPGCQMKDSIRQCTQLAC